MTNFERLLMYTKIDKRKNNWIITSRTHQNISKNVVIGLLVNNTWDPFNDRIKIIHFRFRSTDSTNLVISKCTKENCDVGAKDDLGNCLLSCNRSNSSKLNCAIYKVNESQFMVKQSYYSFLLELDQLKRQQSEINCDNVLISHRDDRKLILIWLFNTNLRVIEELIDIYDKLYNFGNKSWEAYTDGSLYRFENSDKINMGLGWLIVNGDNKVAQFNASSFEWPSSTRMELLAIVSLISILPSESKINIFTDSNNVIEQYKKLNRCMSYRKKKKIINYNLWEILLWIEKEFALHITFTKVKAHSGNKLNDQADYLAKSGMSKLALRINDVAINQKVNLAWLEFSVDKNPREFIKNVNNIRIDNQLENLNRMKSLNNVDKDTALGFINYKDENADLGFFSLKDDHNKSFRIKKLFNDLPTMDNLIKRNPKTYKEYNKCPRCFKDKETLTHLWDCSKANNDLVILSLKAKKKLFKLISQSNKFKQTDELFDDLFPFFKTKKQLERHTNINSTFYKKFDNTKFRLEYTYVWNGVDSFDNILKGWIPQRLIQILRKYMKRESKSFIKNMLIKWLGKVDRMFFEKIWKPRNEDMLLWEKNNGISKAQKRTKIISKSHSRSKKDIRNRNKIIFSGKKKSSVHVLDDHLEAKVRVLFGLNRKDFWRVADKKIMILSRLII